MANNACSQSQYCMLPFVILLMISVRLKRHMQLTKLGFSNSPACEEGP